MSVSETTFMNSYITNKNPNKYGEKQEDFETRSEVIIQAGTKRIIEERKSGGNLDQLFFKLLETFSQERNQIAFLELLGRKTRYQLARYHLNYICKK